MEKLRCLVRIGAGALFIPMRGRYSPTYLNPDSFSSLTLILPFSFLSHYYNIKEQYSVLSLLPSLKRIIMAVYETRFKLNTGAEIPALGLGMFFPHVRPQ